MSQDISDGDIGEGYRLEQVQEFMTTDSPPPLDLNEYTENKEVLIGFLRSAFDEVKRQKESPKKREKINSPPLWSEILGKSTKILRTTISNLSNDLTNMSLDITGTLVSEIENGRSDQLVDSITNVISTYNKSHATNFVHTLTEFGPIIEMVNKIIPRNQK